MIIFIHILMLGIILNVISIIVMIFAPNRDKLVNMYLGKNGIGSMIIIWVFTFIPYGLEILPMIGIIHEIRERSDNGDSKN